MTTLDPQSRAVVRAIDALTTETRRIADHLTTAQQQRDDAPTTTADDVQCAHCGGDHSWGNCTAYTELVQEDALAAAEQTARWARRESLLVLVTRVQHGRTLTDDEARTLRQHVETEMREAETVRADAERYKRDHLNACQTIAAMHAAATGRTGEGPVRGVVEDVEDVRLRAEQAEAALERVREAIDVPSLPRSDADQIITRVRRALAEQPSTTEPS